MCGGFSAVLLTDLEQVRVGHPVLRSVQHVVRTIDGEADRLPRPSFRLDRLMDTDQLRGELIPSLKGNTTAPQNHRRTMAEIRGGEGNII